MSVRYRGEGRGWQARFTIDGVRYEPSGFPTREDAEAFEAETRAKHTLGRATVTVHRPTVAVYARHWLAGYRNGPRSTWEGYEAIVRLHIVPGLGHRRMRDVKPGHVKQLLGQLETDRGAKTAARVYTALHALFSLAEQEDVVDKNPVRSKLHRPRVQPDRMQILEPDEARAVLMLMQGQARDIAVLLLSTGMRWGEMAGLAARGDIDLDAGTVHIRRTANFTEVGPTKNRRRRILNLPARALTVAARLADEAGDVEPIGELPGKVRDLEPFRYRWLVQSGRGRLVDNGNWAVRHLRPAVAAAGIGKHIRPHDLRHSWVSWQLAAGHPIAQVAFWAGDTVATIERTYAHVLKGTGGGAASTVDELLG